MNIEDVLPENKSRYCVALQRALESLDADRVLTHADVQDAVDAVNEEKVNDGKISTLFQRRLSEFFS